MPTLTLRYGFAVNADDMNPGLLSHFDGGRVTVRLPTGPTAKLTVDSLEDEQALAFGLELARVEFDYDGAHVPFNLFARPATEALRHEEALCDALKQMLLTRPDLRDLDWPEVAAVFLVVGDDC